MTHEARKIRVLVLLIVLVGVTAVDHWQALRGDFSNLDDPEIILNNRSIRGLSAQHIKEMFSKSYAGLGGYTPLVLLSYAIEYDLFGLRPHPFHATNLILHIVNVLLIFWLMTLVTGGLGISFVTALFFAIHPVHVEPIAWIQGRKDLLFSFFYLSGLLAYIGYIRRTRQRAFYLAAIVLFGFSLFSKVTAMSFPLVILLLEKHFAGRVDRPALVRTAPFWMLSGTFLLLSFLSHQSMIAQTYGQNPSFWRSLSAFFYAFPFYAGKILAPLKLFPGYQNEIGHDPIQAVISFAAFAVLTALSFFAYRRKPALVTFGVGFAILTLLPTLPFHFFGQPYEDRYLYLPLAGVLVGLAGLLPEDIFTIRPRSRGLLPVGSALLVTASVLAAASSRQVSFWHDSLSLWSHVVRADPRSIVGYFNRARALDEAGQREAALEDYREAHRLAPNNLWVSLSIAGIHFKQRAFDQALREINELIERDPLFYDGYMSRGRFWSYVKEPDKAVVDFSLALAINKTYEAYTYRAQAYIDLQEVDLALADLRQAYRIEPTEQVRELITKLARREAP